MKISLKIAMHHLWSNCTKNQNVTVLWTLELVSAMFEVPNNVKKTPSFLAELCQNNEKPFVTNLEEEDKSHVNPMGGGSNC